MGALALRRPLHSMLSLHVYVFLLSVCFGQCIGVY